MKTLRTILLIILIVGVLTILGILIFFLSGNGSFRFARFGPSITISDQTFESKEFSEINIDLASADVVFRKSEDGDFRVIYVGPESEKDDPQVMVSEDSGQLRIEQKRKIFVFSVVSKREVTVYIPDSFSGRVDYKCASGDMEMTDDFRFEEFMLKVSSGDLRCLNLSADRLSLETSSGDYSCRTIEADELTVKATSGDITIEKVIGTGTIKTVSGDIKIGEYTGGGSISTTSGSIRVYATEVSSDLSVEAISGEIDVSVAEGTSLRLEFYVISGEIDTDVSLDNAKISKSSTKGTIGENPEYRLTIKTTSGDIRFSEK